MIGLLEQIRGIAPENDAKFSQVVGELEGLLSPKEGKKRPGSASLLDHGAVAVELAREAQNKGHSDVSERVLQTVDDGALQPAIAIRKRVIEIEVKVLQRGAEDNLGQKHLLDAMTALQASIRTALTLDDAQVTDEACISLYKLIIKNHKSPTAVTPFLKTIADAWETLGAGSPIMRSRIHYELAHHYGSTNLLSAALQHMQKAIVLYPSADDFMEEMRAKLYKLEVMNKSPFDPTLRHEWKALLLVSSMPATEGSPHILVQAIRLLIPSYEPDDQVTFDLEKALSQQYTFPWSEDSIEVRRETFLSLVEVLRACHSRMQPAPAANNGRPRSSDAQLRVYQKVAFESANYLLGQTWDLNLVPTFFNSQLCEAAAVAVESLRLLVQHETEKLYQFIAATLRKAFDIAMPLPNDWYMRRLVKLFCNFYIRSNAEMRKLGYWIETFEHIYGKLAGSPNRDLAIFVGVCASYAQALLDMELEAKEAQPSDRAAEDKTKGKPGKTGGKPAAREAASATLKLADDVCKAGMENKSNDASVKFPLLQVWKRVCELKGSGPPTPPDGPIRTCGVILALDSGKDASQSIAPLMKELKSFDLAGDILLQLWLHMIRFLSDTKQWELALEGLSCVQSALPSWKQYFPSDTDFREWVATFELTCGQVLGAMAGQRAFDAPAGMCMQVIEHFINGINIACSTKPASSELVSSTVKSFWNVIASNMAEKRRFVEPIQSILRYISKNQMQLDPVACDYLFRLLQLSLHQCSVQKDFTTGLRLLDYAVKSLPKSYHHEIAAMKIIFLGGKDIVAVNIIIKDPDEEAQLWRSLAQTLKDPVKKRESYEQALQILEKAGTLTLKKVEVMIEYAQSLSTQGRRRTAVTILEEGEQLCMMAPENAQTQLLQMKLLTLRAILVESRQERISTLDNAFTQVENVVRQLFERAQQVEIQSRSMTGGKAKKAGQTEAEMLQMPDIDQWDAFSWPEALFRAMNEEDDGITLTSRSVNNSDIMCWLQILASQLIKYEKLVTKSLPVVALMNLISKTCLEDSPETQEVQSGVNVYWAASLLHLGFMENAQQNYKVSLPTLQAKWNMSRLARLFPIRITRTWITKMECYLAWGDLDVARLYATNVSALPELTEDDLFDATTLDALALTASGKFRQSQDILTALRSPLSPSTFMRVSYGMLLNTIGIVALSDRSTEGVEDCLACVRSACSKADSHLQTDPWMMEYSDHLLRIETDLLLRLLKESPGIEKVVSDVLDKRTRYFQTLKDAEMMGEIFMGKARAVPLDGKGQKAERRRLLQSRKILMEGRDMLENARRFDSEVYIRLLLQLGSLELEIALYKDLPTNTGQILDVLELLDAMENKEKDQMEWQKWLEVKSKACDDAIQLLQRHEDNVVEGKGTFHYVLGMSFLEKGGGLQSGTHSRAASGTLSRRPSMHPMNTGADNRMFAEEHLATALEMACEEMNFERMAVIAEAFLTKHSGLDSAAAFNYLALLQGTKGATYLQRLWEESNQYMVTLKALSRTPYIEFPGMPFWKDCIQNTLQKSTVYHIKNDASYGRCQLPPDFAFADWPANLRVLILQHSSDKATLFGGLLRHKGDASKSKKGDDATTEAVVKKIAVHSAQLEVRIQDMDFDESLIKQVEAYLRPLTSALGLDQAAPEPPASASPNKKKGKKEKDKGDAPAEDRTHYILLVDELLEDLPLETILPAISNVKAISRDFDLHMLQERLLSLTSDTAVAEPPKKKEKDKVPESDGSGPDVESLSYFVDGCFPFAKALQASLNRLPSNDAEGTTSQLQPAEWLEMIKRRSAHVFVGEAFPKFLLETIVKVDLHGLHVCAILDNLVINRKPPKPSFSRVKKLAATFSLSGVNTVVVPFARVSETETAEFLGRMIDGSPGLGKTVVETKTQQGINAFSMFGLPPNLKWKT
ncbi:hypothetical protein HK097_007715 [Rhizophlyctis rosea]|uniref:Uncharacterized protein n=1 Tax=Rhizophlyctis rosea TaxID=64517 RepID=A0AAD5SQC9_9FUNG|nr:hypothetical protein HK097_007715 [Rhizophlyctis rosea]